MQIEGKHGPGRPKMAWKTLTERHRCEWNLNKVDPGISTRLILVIGMCEICHACSYLERSPLMWLMLHHLYIYVNADDDNPSGISAVFLAIRVFGKSRYHSRTHHSASNESRNSDQSIQSLTLYHSPHCWFGMHWLTYI